MNINTNLLSPATLSYLRAHAPQAAAHLEAAGDLTPPRRHERHAPRRAVIDNRRLLVIMQNGRIEPAGEDEVIDGEYEELD